MLTTDQTMMNPKVLSSSFLVASADSNDDDLPRQCSMHYKSYQAAIISKLVKTMLTFSSFHPGPDRPWDRPHPRTFVLILAVVVVALVLLG